MNPMAGAILLFAILVLVWELILGVRTIRSSTIGNWLLGVVVIKIADPVLVFGAIYLFCPGDPVEAPLPYFGFLVLSELVLFAAGLLMCLIAWAKQKDRKRR